MNASLRSKIPFIIYSSCLRLIRSAALKRRPSSHVHAVLCTNICKRFKMAVLSNNPEDSIFRRFLALYVRHVEGTLAHSAGPQCHIVTSSWDQIRPQLPLPSDAPSRTSVAIRYDDSPVRAVALEQIRDGQVTGLVLLDTFSEVNIERFFAYIILRGAHISATPSRACSALTDAIVDHFDKTIRYITKDDQWDYTGRDYFRSRVGYYTSRDARLELCLPAFPCKSSNPHKVNGVRPDRGEYMALVSLHNFVRGVEQIYAPGAKIWIISDGHVFSDCSKQPPAFPFRANV